MVRGEKAEHKEEEEGISVKCRLSMEGSGFSVKDFLCVTGEMSDFELGENEHPQAAVGMGARGRTE